MAYQFAHTQTYSRKGNGKSRSVSSVVAEAVRLEGYCPHVDTPLQPTILHGISPDAIPALIEQRIAKAKECFAEEMKGKGRGIRQDQHVLEGAVFSHPYNSSELSDQDTRDKYLQWRNDVLNWIKEDFDKRGMDFISAVEHLDESHPHIHAYGIPRATEDNPRMDAKLCHAGYSAKAAESVLERKNTAYRDAMRNWQDSHYKAVSERYGLLRFGPKRARLDRKAYTIQKVVAKDLASKIRLADSLSNVKTDLNHARTLHKSLASDIDELQARREQLIDKAMEESLQAHSNPIGFTKELLLTKLTSENERLESEINALKIELAKFKPLEKDLEHCNELKL